MTSDDEPSAGNAAKRATPASLGAASGPAARPGALIAHRTRLAASRHRPWWKWLLIGLLLAFSLATTWLYAAALIGAVSRHHWAAALDASRDAVPAAVGWAALLLLFFPHSSPEARRLLSADDRVLNEKLTQAARDQVSMDNAEQKVQGLSAKLARLTAAREHAAEPGRIVAEPEVTYLDPGSLYLGADDAELCRAVAETTARLEQARQWLTSARDAVAVSQRAVADAEDRLVADFPDLIRHPAPTARKPA
jgi:hypothetical protein